MADVTKIIDPALEAFKPFEHFCKSMLDGFVVVNSRGKIVKSNPMVAQLSGLTSKLLLSLDSFDDAFKLEMGDTPLTVAQILASKGPQRFDEITCRAAGGSGNELRLIIGFYPFVENGQPVGGWLLLRDVTAETQLQDKYRDKATKSITDPMTGLFNRAHFEDYMLSQVSALGQLPLDSDHRKLSVIMGDIDFFKKINDKFGHPAGDYVIKTVAQLIMKAVRKTDVVCRYGGEEFLIILPASDLEGSAIAAEKVRTSIESHPFEFEGTKHSVRMSFGVAQLMVGAEEGKDVIARADAALYSSKQNGRNQVSLHVGTTIEPSQFKPAPLPTAV